MMQHVEPENICDAIRSERELLCVGNSVEPGAPDDVCRENLRRELFEKTGSRANFDGEAVRFSEGEQPHEKFIVVDAPQNGFLRPNAAMPEKMLLSLRIDGHCAFLIVLT
jgi:hypothetical protein